MRLNGSEGNASIVGMLILLVAGLLMTVVVDAAGAAPVNSIPMKIVNEAGAPIELYWVNVFNRNELVKQTTKPIRNSSDTTINSYHTHRFQVQFFKRKAPEPLYTAEFVKGPREEVVTIGFENNKFTIKQSTKYDEIMSSIKSAAKTCRESHSTSEGAYNACIARSVVDELHTISESKSSLTKYRDRVSERLRNYTCSDTTLETSESISSFPINFKDGRKLTGEVLLDLPESKIWYVENFITDAECEVFKKYGKPRLSRATVAAEDGTSIVSENRKANQASYNLHEHNPKDPLVPLYQRIFDVTNLHTGYGLTLEGQEDFTIIQYDKNDEYKAHCDGTCDGSMHIPGGRIATAVLYCEVPTVGGATTFSKADIYIKPKKGMATFFAYKGPNGKMDEGYTEHSGCPVIEGEKWITTVWMREGVSKENDWTEFDPSGLKIFDSDKEKATEVDIGVDGSA